MGFAAVALSLAGCGFAEADAIDGLYCSILGDTVVFAAVALIEGSGSVKGFIFSNGRTIDIGGATILIRMRLSRSIHMM